MELTRKAIVLLLATAAVAQGTWTAHKTPVTGKLPADWRTLPQTGQKLVQSAPGKSVWVSADGLHKATLTSVGGGLDVECYQVDLDGKLVADAALEATFSPDSRFLFLSKGPHPVVVDVGSGRISELPLDSGLENAPVWVHSWSKDGTALTLHQQKRFDDSADPVEWKVQLK